MLYSLNKDQLNIFSGACVSIVSPSGTELISGVEYTFAAESTEETPVYTWTIGGVSYSGNNVHYTPSATGTLSVSVSDGVNTAEQEYTVYAEGTITASISPVSGAETVTLGLTATCTAQYTYSVQWQRLTGSTWVNIAGATSLQSTVTGFTVSQAETQLRCTITGAGATTASDSVTYTAEPVVSASISPATISAIPATITLTYSARYDVSHQWYVKIGSASWIAIPDTSYVIQTAAIHTFKVIAQGYNGTSTESAELPCGIAPAVSIRSIHSGDILNPNWRYNLVADVSGFGTLTTTWTIGSSTIAGNPAVWTSPQNIGVSNQTVVVTCTATSEYGTASASVTVYIRPTQMILYSPADNASTGTTTDFDCWNIYALWDSLDGFGTQTAQVETYNRADYSANVACRTKYTDRIVSFTLIAQSNTISGLESVLDLLLRACNNEHTAADTSSAGKTHLELFVPGLSKRVMLFGYVTAGYPKIRRKSPTSVYVEMSFTAPDARFYLGADSAVSVVPAAVRVNTPATAFSNVGDGWGIVKSMPIAIGSQTVHSSNASVPDITNASGQTIDGCTIATDWQTGKITCTYQNNNYLYKISPTCDLSKFRIAPGSQTISGLQWLEYYPTWRGVTV